MKKDVLKILDSSRSHLSPTEISQYLNNELEEELRFDIENHLLDCELCTAAIQGYSKAKIPVPEINVADLRKQMQKTSIPAELQAPKAKVVPFRRNYNWAIAAALLVLLGFAGVQYFQSSSSDLYATYYQPYDKALLASRSGGEDINPTLTEGLSAYENDNFSKSLQLLKKAKSEDPENGIIALYAGMAALELGNFEESATFLSEARINHLASYATATWYLAMNYLAKKDYANCRNMLRQLGPQDSPYYARAQELLGKLSE